MEKQIFNREGIENPLLFAAGAGFARTSFAKLGQKYNDAILATASKPGNEGLRRSLMWVSEQPLSATESGALKYGTRFAQFGTRQTVKGLKLGGEALTGALGIRAGEAVGGLYDVMRGEKTISHLFEEITDAESLSKVKIYDF